MSSASIEGLFPNLSDITKIGEGGQKKVFRATHPEYGVIALKLLNKAADLVRLERELLAGKSIQNAHVPLVFENGSVNFFMSDYHWVMEQYITGNNLRDHLNQHKKLTPKETIVLMEVVLDVLADVHNLRIIHRDIKPENIMLDDTGKFWVLDFGLARHLDLQTITYNQAMGTLGYSPPEQMRGMKALMDPRTDFFPLGVMCYECLVGINPFRHQATTEEEIKHRVMRLRIPSMNLACDPEGFLDELISTMTQKYPNQRPESVAEIQSWLNEIKTNLNL